MKLESLSTPSVDTPFDADKAALWLRAGLGLVFVIGGYSKLSQLLDPTRADALVELYTGPGGYINALFLDYLFEGPLAVLMTPWLFLTALSAFELVSGILLVIGLLIRPLALVYAFLLWTFVFSLPVVTTPDVALSVDTYTSPALFVQVRDVALSGLMFVLFNLGADRWSLDRRRTGARRTGTAAPIATRDAAGPGATTAPAEWNALGLLTRLSLAAPLLVGGFFAGFDSIQSFATWPLLLVVLGTLLVAGNYVRPAAIVVAVVMLWFIAGKISLDKSLIANLNGFKREFALLAAAAVLARFGGGVRFVWRRPTAWRIARRGDTDETAPLSS